jgi:SAM-dependent methyltransferase
MTDVFGSDYSRAYDTLYAEKDYEAESELIVKMFGEHADSDIKRILDLGCGTGNHLFPLLARGFDVTGVDRSVGMLERLKEKAAAAGVSPRVEHSSIASLDLDERFDAALMMFAVLGYHRSNDEVVQALDAARRHLIDGGLLLFDVWYGPAVLHERPGDRVRVLDRGLETTLRVATSELVARDHLVRVGMELWEMRDDRVLNHVQEDHWMRFFFPKELELLLDVTGFTLLRLGAFPDVWSDPDETTWNVLAVARADH